MVKYSTLKLRLNLTFLIGALLFVSCSDEEDIVVYVNDPVPASFADLSAAGRTGNTFTVTTNSTVAGPVSFTTTDSSMITNLNALRSVLDAANGIYVWTVTFDVSENKSISSRSATLSISIDGISKTVTVSQQGITASSPTHTQDGLANCYTVAPGGDVSFPVSRAYVHTGTAFTNTLHTGGEYTSDFGVEVAWQDVTNLVTPSIVSGTGKDTRVNIRVNGSTPGNAVVKIYKAGDTSKIPVWSYHIWVTDYTGSATWTNPNQTAHTYTFMDRNLGATEAANSLAGRGLLYQWGRKDPFPGIKAGTAGFAALDKFYGIDQSGAGSTTAVQVSSNNNAAAIVESIQKPTTFYTNKHYYGDWLPTLENTLWSTTGDAGGSKTIYDPCPSGWRVPAYTDITSTSDDYSPWKGVAIPTKWTEGSDTGGVTNWGTNALYPAAGSRSYGSGSINFEGSNGDYWSASPDSSSSSNASHLYFNYSGYIYRSTCSSRAFGFSVRCAQE